MKIRFETAVNDVIAFNRFHYAHSPTWRRQVRTQMLILPGIIGALFLLAYFSMRPIPDGDLWAVAVFGVPYVVLSSVWMLFIRWYMYWALERNTRKYFAEGSNRSMRGWRQVELINGRLQVQTELIHSSIDLRAIEKIVGNDDYTFVYIASISAIVIPMHLYPEDEYRDFVTELREAWENRGIGARDDESETQERSIRR